MKIQNIIIVLALVLIAGLMTVSHAYADPSNDFKEESGEVYDDWEVCRTRSFGTDGFYQITERSFRPVITFESLGRNAESAYKLGNKLASEYPDQLQRAEKVFLYVRNRVNYTPDVDQFEYSEYAQNADEMVIKMNQNGVVKGDCEDSAVLLAVMYKGAGFRSAIAVGEGHTAAMVYLPDYKKASLSFEVAGEPGWVWAEATGGNNPLGWAPKEFINVEMAAYEITDEEPNLVSPVDAPAVAIARSGGGGGFSVPFPFFSVLFLLWILPVFRRKRAQ